MGKTVHDETRECVVCENDCLRERVDQLEKNLDRLRRELDEECRAVRELSEYKSASGALLDVAAIKQQVAKRCIEIIIDGTLTDACLRIKSEFGL